MDAKDIIIPAINARWIKPYPSKLRIESIKNKPQYNIYQNKKKNIIPPNL